MASFSAMQTLVRVVDAGSFSDAARQLGVKLLARTTRGLSVTEAGQRY